MRKITFVFIGILTLVMIVLGILVFLPNPFIIIDNHGSFSNTKTEQSIKKFIRSATFTKIGKKSKLIIVRLTNEKVPNQENVQLWQNISVKKPLPLVFGCNWKNISDIVVVYNLTIDEDVINSHLASQKNNLTEESRLENKLSKGIASCFMSFFDNKNDATMLQSQGILIQDYFLKNSNQNFIDIK